MSRTVTLTVNGNAQKVTPRAGLSLLLFLRNDLSLTGTKQGCSAGGCGACTVLLDGVPVQSCLTPLAGADGKHVQTIEALGGTARGAKIARALNAEGAAQCGYCLPGIVATVVGKGALHTNICRCGTQHRILKALASVPDDD